MSEQDKICPIKKENCNGEECAWWNHKEKECAVLTISWQLLDISYTCSHPIHP